METIIPNQETINYLTSRKVYDIFPDSINSLDEVNLTEEQKNAQKERFIGFMESEILQDIESDNNINYKLEKNITEKIKLTPNNMINCICSYNNILLIASNNELKIYDISDDFDCYGTIKMPGYDKNILCLAVTEYKNILYGVIGGDFSSIHVIDILNVQELTGCQLIGHKNKVYQLEFHPFNNYLLLSASKDCTVRLWNFKLPELLVIFGGPNSFESDVLCIDWNFNGEYFVGSGVDCVVRIYKIDEMIQKTIDISMKKGEVETILKASPYFSCNDVHDNLIDCIKYNNKFIISKSVDGIIKEWLPYIDDKGQNLFFLINIFVFNTKQLIFGIKFCFVENIIVVGNEMGQIILFNKGKTELKKEVSEDNFFQNNYTQIIQVNKNNDTLLKNINYNPYYNLLFFGGNNGEVYIYKLNKENE